MSGKHRIVITGGGTGGHVYPALAVYEKLKSDPEVEAILYMGASGHLEERLTAERNIPYKGLRSAGLPRSISPALVAWPFVMFGAVQDARSALLDFHPTAVLGTGGYAAAPPLAAALTMGVPYAIHEPDAHPGLVNKLFANWAALCSLGMEGAKSRLAAKGAVKVNGNPVNDKFLAPPSKEQARLAMGLESDLRTLLVTGGSQGAQALNEALLEALQRLLAIEPPIQIFHQVGDKTFDEFKAKVDATPAAASSRYKICAYINDVAQAYAAADLTLCRSGAMTIADITASGTPAIFVPYPYATQDHQTSNARFIESKNAAVLIDQKSLSADKLFETCRDLFADADRLATMSSNMRALGKPHAAQDIADQVKHLSDAYLSQKK